MKLYGSTTSPYVRRVRVVLSQTPHEFINLQIFEGDDRETLADRNPALKVPCLEDDGQVIFDSRVIYRYLADKFRYQPLTWEQENQLTLVDAANDSFVSLLLMKRSEYDTTENTLFLRLQKERIDATLEALDKQLALGGFESWDYPAICLYTLIDWVEFRQLHRLEGFEQLKAFREKHVDRIELTATDPRQ